MSCFPNRSLDRSAHHSKPPLAGTGAPDVSDMIDRKYQKLNRSWVGTLDHIVDSIEAGLEELRLALITTQRAHRGGAVLALLMNCPAANQRTDNSSGTVVLSDQYCGAGKSEEYGVLLAYRNVFFLDYYGMAANDPASTCSLGKAGVALFVAH